MDTLIDREEPSLIERMRNARYNSEAVFMRFVGNRQFFETYAFCFYEGEDGKYYDLRIRDKFANKFITYTVGSKSEVLKLFKKITEEKVYDSVCTMFFIDNDYDDSLWGNNDKVYETPCYSIENLYSSETTFRNILQSEFGLTHCELDFEKCINCYNDRLEEFNEIMREFNILGMLKKIQHNAHSSFQLSKIKTHRLANISLSKITKSHNYDEEIEKLKSVLSVSTDEFEYAEQRLEERGVCSASFRGKNQLDFLVKMVNLLKEENTNGSFFSEKLRTVHINITNNRLSELSQYAETPQRLLDFLDKHYKQLVS